MKVYRFAYNPYRASSSNTAGNDFGALPAGGVFCFDPSRKAVSYTSVWNEEEHKMEYNATEIDVNAMFLIGQFAFGFEVEDTENELDYYNCNNFMFDNGAPLRSLDIDENEIIARGTGRYANMFSDNADDYIYIPECYVMFSEY